MESMKIDLPIDDHGAFTISGTMKEYSTESLHTHSCHQILGIKNGISFLLDSHRKQPLYGSMIALIPAETPHRSLVYGDQASYKSIYIGSSLLRLRSGEIQVFDSSSLSLALLDKVDFPWNAPVDSLMEDCLRLLLKIVEEERKNCGRSACLPEASLDQNRKLIRFIEDNYKEKLRLKDFAAEAILSTRQVSRIFKEDLNITIMEYLKLYRVFTASVLLSDAQKTITEIVYDSGYDSVSCFYKDFKDTFSFSPKEFRQQFNANPYYIELHTT